MSTSRGDDATSDGPLPPFVTAAVSLTAGLGAGTLTASLLDTTAPVTAVAEEVIDGAPRSVKDAAISLFGTADKMALAIGIVVILLAAGTATVHAGRRRRSALAVGVAGFAVLGQVALGSFGAGSVAIVVAAGVTWAAMSWLEPGPAGAATSPDAGVAEATPMPPPRWSGRPGRRDLLARAGVLGAGGIAALAGAAGVSRGRDAQIRADAPSLEFPPEGSPAAAPPVSPGTSIGSGVEPFITPEKDFYRIDTAFVAPRVDLDGWTLKIGGAVRTPLELTYEDLLERDMVERVVTLSCVSNEVGGDLVGNASWLGVPLADLLDEVGVEPEGTQVFSRSVDGWTCGFPTDIAVDGRDALVAVGMNGESLSIDHGFPARLVVPGLYGYVSATKWLSEIELVGWDDAAGYWIDKGWAKEAPIKTQSRIDVPRRGQTVTPGPTPIAGVAWAPHRGISGVEVRVDDDPWQPARLADDGGDDAWRQWMISWDATPGEHRIAVRATDGEGETQTRREAPPDPDGATGWHTIRVDVDRA